jgi:hypothetical protein
MSSVTSSWSRSLSPIRPPRSPGRGSAGRYESAEVPERLRRNRGGPVGRGRSPETFRDQAGLRHHREEPCAQKARKTGRTRPPGTSKGLGRDPWLLIDNGLLVKGFPYLRDGTNSPLTEYRERCILLLNILLPPFEHADDFLGFEDRHSPHSYATTTF